MSWLLPLVISMILFELAWATESKPRVDPGWQEYYNFPFMGEDPIGDAAAYGTAVIGSLLAWGIWLLLSFSTL